MPIQYVNTGSSANAGNGDSIRLAFTKVNNNFALVATQVADLQQGIFDNITIAGTATFLDIVSTGTAQLNNVSIAGTVSGTSTFQNIVVEQVATVNDLYANTIASANTATFEDVVVNGSLYGDFTFNKLDVATTITANRLNVGESIYVGQYQFIQTNNLSQDFAIVKDDINGLTFVLRNVHADSYAELNLQDNIQGGLSIVHQDSTNNSGNYDAGQNYIYGQTPDDTLNIGKYSNINIYANQAQYYDPNATAAPSINISKDDGLVRFGSDIIYMNGISFQVVSDGSALVNGVPIQGGSSGNGYTGSQGDTGGLGYTGSAGPLGYSGSRGVTGYTGSTGYTGFTGSAGLHGYTGSQGLTGLSGYTGSVGFGYSGSKGDTGAQGISVTLVGSTATSAGLPLTGNPGDGWIVNNTGHLWFWNSVAGAWNDIGTIVGPQGNAGPKGDQGLPGNNGQNGFTGSAGANGTNGTNGTNGYTGSAGTNGTNGATGFTGSAGNNGTNGATGYTGSGGLGYTGSAGSIGTTGYWGSRGYTGSAGTNGTNGFTGSAGTNGTNGFTGSAGTNGTNGTTGFTGSTGANGYTGSAGLLGYYGSVGARGFNGFTGSAGLGSTGYTGSAGTNGTNGDIGYTGSRAQEDRLVNNGFEFTLGVDGSLNLPDSGASPGTAIVQSTANILLNSNGQYWTFGNDGDLTFPGNSLLIGVNEVNTSVILNAASGKDFSINTFGPGLNNWKFGADGFLTLPGGNSKITTTGPTGESVDLVAGPGGWAELASSTGSNYVWVDDTAAYIATNAVGAGPSTKMWTFASDGNMSTPGNIVPTADLVYDLGSPTLQWRSIYVGTGTVYIGGVALGVNQDNYVTVDGNPIITVNTASGALTIQGDTNIILGSVAVSDIAPEATTTGSQWYNTLDGRTYIAYSGQWIDSSPTVVPTPDTYLGDITIDGSTININDSTLTISNSGTLLVNGSEVVSGNNQTIYGASLIASETDPGTSTGTLWFNTIEGRTYLKYNDQWVDVNPTVVPPPSTYLDEITIDGSTINMNGSTLAISTAGVLLVNGEQVTGSGGATDRLTTGSHSIVLGSDGMVTFPTIDGTKTLWGAVDEDFEIKTTRTNPGQDADINLTAADDIWIDALGDDIILTAANQVRINSDSTGSNYNWIFAEDGSTTFPNNTILGTGEDPNVYIETSTTSTTSTWTFGTNGVLTLPSATPIIKGGGTGTDVTVVATTGSNTATWVFAADGSITFPDASIQTTAYTGGSGGLSGNPFSANIDEFTTTQGVYLGIGDITPRIIFANGSEPNWQIDNDGSKLRIFQPNNVAVSINTSTFTIETNSLLIHNNINIDGENMGLVVDASGLKRFGFMKYTSIEGALVHSTVPGAEVPLRFGRVPLADITSATSNDLVTEIHVGTNGYVSIGDNYTGSERLSVDGNIQATGKLIGNTATIGVGGLTVDGPVTFNSSFTFLGTATVISSNSGTFYGDTYGVGALYAGVAGFSPLPSTVIQSSANVNAYIQNNFQNINSGNQASTEWVATANNGDDSNHYLDMGIAGSAWDGSQSNSVGTAAGANDSWIYAQGSTSTSAGGNLILGTIKNGKAVKILAGSTGSSSVVATFNGTGLTLSTSSSRVTFNNNTGSYIAGDTSIRAGSISLQPYTGAGSSPFSGVIVGGNGRLLAPNGSVHMVFNSTTLGVQVPITSIVGNPSTSASSGAIYMSGGCGFGNDSWFGTSVKIAGTSTSTSTTTGALIVSGGVGIAGNAYVGGSVVTPNNPAFRVYGSVSTDISTGTTVSATHGVLVDYNQGSYYSTSTGIFTAPVAGLYHCFATLRVGSNNGLNQASIQKNSSSTGSNVIAFWETDTNTGSATHFGMTGYARLAAGDTVRLQVITGKIQFDINDSWGVTFIG